MILTHRDIYVFGGAMGTEFVSAITEFCTTFSKTVPWWKFFRIASRGQVYKGI